MVQRQPDESLGLDHLPQSQLEAVPSSITAPVMEAVLDRQANGDDTDAQSPQAVLRSLVSNNGLVAVLEAFQSIMETQIERLQDSSMRPYAQQLSAFQAVANNLAELVEHLPAELDIELALTQITHTAPVIEESSVTLTDGSE